VRVLKLRAGRAVVACLVAVGVVSGAAACSGRNLHRDLTADTQIMVRKWVIPTHGPFEAGDRGIEYSNTALVENTLIFGNSGVGLVSIYPLINQQRWALPIRGGVVSELSVDHGSVFFGGGTVSFILSTLRLVALIGVTSFVTLLFRVQPFTEEGCLSRLLTTLSMHLMLGPENGSGTIVVVHLRLQQFMELQRRWLTGRKC
jgi:hypothetical protein